jgi:hypothetical protein
MKSGLYWRILSSTTWRFPLRDGFVMAAAGTTPPGPGLMKTGLYWRISSWTNRRFLLRDGFVMAAAETHALF